MIAMGIQETTVALIGNSIGANNVALAKRFFWLIFKMTACLVGILCLTMALGRE